MQELLSLWPLTHYLPPLVLRLHVITTLQTRPSTPRSLLLLITKIRSPVPPTIRINTTPHTRLLRQILFSRKLKFPHKRHISSPDLELSISPCPIRRIRSTGWQSVYARRQANWVMPELRYERTIVVGPSVHMCSRDKARCNGARLPPFERRGCRSRHRNRPN